MAPSSPSFLRRSGWMVLVIVLAVGLTGGAAYLGYHNSQANAAQVVVPPPTVTVDRGAVILSVTAPGVSEDTGAVTLSSTVSAMVAQVSAQPGELVKKGQVLVTLGPQEIFAAALSQAQVSQLQAQQALDALLAGAPESASQASVALVQAQKALSDARAARQALDYPRATPLRLAGLQADAQAADLALAQAQAAYDRVAGSPLADPARTQALHALIAAQQARDNAQAALSYALGKPGPADLAAADAAVAQAQAALEQAQRQWDALKDGPDKVQLQLAQANLANAQNNVDKAQSDLVSLQQAAPFDGVILAVGCHPGQAVGPGAALVTLTDPKAMDVLSTVVEQDLPLVQVGQPVQVFFDALPDVNLTGAVARIVPQRSSDTQAIYPVYITLDQIPDHLVPGMTATGSIIIAQRPSVLRLPRAVVHAHPDGSAQVMVWANGQETRRSIRVGLRGDSFVEVLSGLALGEQVAAQ